MAPSVAHRAVTRLARIALARRVGVLPALWLTLQRHWSRSNDTVTALIFHMPTLWLSYNDVDTVSPPESFYTASSWAGRPVVWEDQRVRDAGR